MISTAMRPLPVCYKLDRSVKLSWLHKLTRQHVELTSVCEIKMTHFFISRTAGGIWEVIFQNRLKCIHNHIFSCLLGLNSLCKLSFLFLEMCLSEYHCWEIIMLWMGAFPLCSAACFILAVFLKALRPQAYPSTHLNHSSISLSTSTSFSPSILFPL